MKKFLLLKCSLLATALLATNVYAVLIEGSFQGTVRTFNNGIEDIGITGYWDSVAEGSRVSGSFWYDSDKAPGNTSDFSTSALYQSYTDEWAGSSFTIDGKTYYISNLPLLDRYNIKSEGVWLHNFEPAVDSSTKEMFNFFDNISTGSSDAGYRAIGLTVEINSWEKPLLSGLGIVQEFDWYDLGDSTSYAQAYISIGEIAKEGVKDSNAWVDINEFHLRIKSTTTVPEPTSIFLWCLAAFALLAKCNRSW